MKFLTSRSCCGCCIPNQTTDIFVSEKDTWDKCTASPAAGGWLMGWRTAWTLQAGCPPSYWSCASWRCFFSPGQPGPSQSSSSGSSPGKYSSCRSRSSLAIALEGISCYWLCCSQMKSHLCILETVKPLKIILDSSMASKMKNIDPKQVHFFFYPKDGFH